MSIDAHDERESYCKILGHHVVFKYCRVAKEGTPCGNILDCWHENFDVAGFLEDNYTPEQIKVIQS